MRPPINWTKYTAAMLKKAIAKDSRTGRDMSALPFVVLSRLSRMRLQLAEFPPRGHRVRDIVRSRRGAEQPGPRGAPALRAH